MNNTIVLLKWLEVINDDGITLVKKPKLLIDYPTIYSYSDVTGGVAIPDPNAYTARFILTDEELNLIEANPEYTVLTVEPA